LGAVANLKRLPQPDYPLPSGASKVGEGPHGPIIDGLQGRFEDARDWLRNAKTGDVQGAISHPDLPNQSSDLVYGNIKGGVKHTDWKHPGALDQLPSHLDSLELQDSPTRARLSNDDFMASFRKDYDGAPKTWLLTAFEPGKKYSNFTPYLPLPSEIPWSNVSVIPASALPHWDNEDDNSRR
jgi:hypothetical protein